MRGGFGTVKLFRVAFQECRDDATRLQRVKQLLREFAWRSGRTRIIFLRHGASEMAGYRGLREVFVRRKGYAIFWCGIVLKSKSRRLFVGVSGF